MENSGRDARHSGLLLLVLIVSGISMLSAQIIPLDGEWQFAVDPSRSLSVHNVNNLAHWRKAVVPMSWQAQFEDLRDYEGVAWYKKAFTVESPVNPGRIILHFEAVDYRCSVFVNGILAGEHEGGYSPFEFDILPMVHPEENEILVRVMDPVSSGEPTEGIRYWHIPHGKQSWYVQTSGIWRSVWMEFSPKERIEYLRVTPDISGKVHLELGFHEPLEGEREIVITLTDPDGRLLATTPLRGGGATASKTLMVMNPALWSPSTPSLYTVTASFPGGHGVTERFGFRSLEARNGKLFLNGEPIYLRGALDQDFYPETIYSTPSAEYLRDQMQKAKAMGLNLLRCHIKIPDRRYLSVADEVGLLVWTEIPNWGVFSTEAARRGEETLFEMIDRDWNHPSFVILSIINESWGVDLQKEDQRRWLTSVFDRIKSRAKGRLVVDNSACWGNFHLKTDLNDYHTYWAIPEGKQEFDRTVGEFARRPAWLFSPFGDSRQTGREPLVLSEFGNWGLPVLPAKLPWWFSRGFKEIEVTMPAGVFDRFGSFGYNRVFGDYETLALASQQSQAAALKYQIEALRLQAGIEGYVITEFTDIHWEANGLLDMWRDPKRSALALRDIQQDDVIIPRISRHCFFAGEKIRVTPWISHYSSATLVKGRVQWSWKEESGSLEVVEIARGTVQSLEDIVLTASASEEPSVLTLQLTDESGRVLAKNSLQINVYRRPEPDLALGIHDKGSGVALRSAFEGMGYKPIDSPVVPLISTVLDESIKAELEQGRTVVWFADTSATAPPWFPYRLIPRTQEWYDGNWATSLHWVRADHDVFRGLTNGPQLGFEASAVFPRVVIGQVPPPHFQDVLAGMFVGWIHLNAASVLQLNAFKGRLLVCTLPLLTAIPDDPFARVVLHRLVQYASDRNWKPSTSIHKDDN